MWDLALVFVLWRVRDRGALFFVVAFALISLYTVDRALPRVLVDAWPNFDAAGSPALRPWFVLPDLVLLGAVATRGRLPISRAAAVIVGLLALAVIGGLVTAVAQPAIPFSAAAFWALVPVRGILVVLLVDATVRRSGPSSALSQVVDATILGGSVLAIELIAVSLLKAGAELVGVDLVAIWSGFDWVRPNLPGWNNNLAASAVSLGGATAILLAARSRLPTRWIVLSIAVSLIAMLLAEYRTAIIVIVLASSIRAGLAAASWLRSRRSRAIVLPSVGVSVVTGALLLFAASLAVPRLADLNPVAFVAGSLGGGPTAEEPDEVPTDETDTSSTSRGQILQAALSVWSRQPLTGPGLGAWEFDRPTEPTFLQKAITPHNGYAWILADLGVIGMAGFFVVPGILVLARRHSVSVLALAILLAILEVSIAGVAHARYAIAFWAVLGVLALVTLRPEDSGETVEA